MTEQPIPTYPAPSTPPARSSRRWLFIVLGVVALCLIACCAISLLGGGSAFGPVMAAAQLPTVCEQNNADMDAQACASWTTGVAGTPEFQECVTEAMNSGQSDANSLYACLVEKGVGP